MRRIRGPRLSRRAFVGVAGAAVIAWTLPLAGHAAEPAAKRPLQIWFIRHAESEINVPGSPRPVPDGGVSYPLTREGVEQARGLAAALSGVPVTAIYTTAIFMTTAAEVMEKAKAKAKEKERSEDWDSSHGQERGT